MASHAEDPATNPNILTADELARGLQTLPSELYNIIYDLTFTTTPNNQPHRIDKTYKPPTTLQIDRASRSQAAQSFYTNITFNLPVKAGLNEPDDAILVNGRLVDPVNDTLAHSWLLSLTPEHLRLLRKVRVVSPFWLIRDSVFLVGDWFEDLGIKAEVSRGRTHECRFDFTVELSVNGEAEVVRVRDG